MNYKKAISYGALLWALIFFEVSILMFGFNLNPPATLYYILHYFLLAVFTVVSAKWYFTQEKKSNLTKRFLVGLVFVVTGIILDAIITVPLFVKDYTAFFSTKWMLIGYLEVIVLAAVYGANK